MRIAVVTTSYPSAPGDPAGHFVRTEVERLRARGHEVDVVSPRAGGAFGWPGVAARLRERPWLAADAARFVVSARRQLDRARCDYVVAHWAVPCAFPIAHDSGAALEIVSHGADVRLFRAMPKAIASRVATRLAERATTWRFVSASLAREMLDALSPSAGRAVERVTEIRPASIEVPNVRARAARIRGQTAGTLLVTVGRLVPSKRVEAVLAHARALPDATIAIVGDGPERSRLEAIARRDGQRAVFTGLLPRDEALAWIAAADELVHASRAEGLSTVVREAEALGTPVRVLD